MWFNIIKQRNFLYINLGLGKRDRDREYNERDKENIEELKSIGCSVKCKSWSSIWKCNLITFLIKIKKKKR